MQQSEIVVAIRRTLTLTCGMWMTKSYACVVENYQLTSSVKSLCKLEAAYVLVVGASGDNKNSVQMYTMNSNTA